MGNVNLKDLVGKLNETCRTSLEGAGGLCLSRTNHYVELEHFFSKLLENTNCDATLALQHFGVDVGRVLSDATQAIDTFKTGNTRAPGMSVGVVDMIKEAWMIASIDLSTANIRSGHILLAMLGDRNLSVKLRSVSNLFSEIPVETLRTNFDSILGASDEEKLQTVARSESSPVSGSGPSGPTQTPSLDQFTVDLTGRARDGAIDPIVGRDNEIRQMIDILLRRRQNNPIMTGEAGVGKTAVVEGFALRIASGDVPPPLKEVSIRTLDLGLLQAGAGVKGEFENRLKSVIQEVKSSPTPIILFIDEAHTMIGAGGAAGQNDAANLLKPALARGELRTIAATTWAEYKKYFERDAALARRFQVVKVEEPTEDVAIKMMRGIVSSLEDHHEVEVTTDAIDASVHLSSRYISGRQLPDKSVSLVDTACARISLSQTATPAAVEDCEKRLVDLDKAIEMLLRESSVGVDHVEELAELQGERETTERELDELKTRWNREKELVVEILELKARLTGKSNAVEADGSDEVAAQPTEPMSDEQRQQMVDRVNQLRGELAEVRGEMPLVHECVDSTAIAETVESWTGIPVGRMVSNEINTILTLKQRMEESVIGQSHALETIAKSIQTSRAKLTDPNRPIGVFLLAGTSGVGKTETAVVLSELLYGGEQNMTVINMSEFKEEHKVSLLMGSPPGYVGYGEGGVLTEAVRRKPYSIVLLDEMEKAHPGVQDIFYQVFDKGSLRDGEGRDIDFKNTIILMTSNAGTDFIKSLCTDEDTRPDPEGFGKAVFPELLKTFKPAFLGRCTVVPYYTLSDDVMRKIIRLKMNKIKKRVKQNHDADLSYTDELVDAVAARCTEVDTGARNVDHILNKNLLPQLSTEFLGALAAGKPLTNITITSNDEGFVFETA